MAELRQLGGALGRVPERHGLLPTVDAAFAMVAVAVVPDGDSAGAGSAAVQELSRALEPWTTERRYLGFTAEQIDVRRAFDAAAYRRLQRIKAEVDPEGLFRANHAVEAASRS